MSGYIGQRKGLGKNPDEIQFLLDRTTGVEKIFQDRYATIRYLKDVMHMAIDDLRFVYWFETGEDLPRYILTGTMAPGGHMKPISQEEVTKAVAITPENKSDIDILKWSGKGPIPAVGDTVRIKMNDHGLGTVMAYADVEGYLAIKVLIHAPRPWFLESLGGKNRPVTFFGVDIAVDELSQIKLFDDEAEDPASNTDNGNFR